MDLLCGKHEDALRPRLLMLILDCRYPSVSKKPLLVCHGSSYLHSKTCQVWYHRRKFDCYKQILLTISIPTTYRFSACQSMIAMSEHEHGLTDALLLLWYHSDDLIELCTVRLLPPLIGPPSVLLSIITCFLPHIKLCTTLMTC